MSEFVHQLIPLFILANLLPPLPIEYIRNSIQLQRLLDPLPIYDHVAMVAFDVHAV